MPTVQDVINAIRKDGYAQAFGELVEYDSEGNILEACAVGQAALNLDINPDDLMTQLDDMELHPNGKDSELSEISTLSGLIIHYNDSKKYPLSKIADLLERKLPTAIRQLEVGEEIEYDDDEDEY